MNAKKGRWGIFERREGLQREKGGMGDGKEGWKRERYGGVQVGSGCLLEVGLKTIEKRGKEKEKKNGWVGCSGAECRSAGGRRGGGKGERGREEGWWCWRGGRQLKELELPTCGKERWELPSSLNATLL